MSISIGRIPVYQSTETPIRIYTGSSNLVSLRSDLPNTNIYFNNDFHIGQNRSQEDTFRIQIGNVELIRSSSNLLLYTSNTQFLSNVQIEQNILVQSNLYTKSIITCNVSLYGNQAIPLQILNSSDTIFQITKIGTGYIHGNLGIGITGSYDLDISQSARIQSNLIIGNLTQTTTLTTSNLRSSSNLVNLIDLNPNYLLIDAPQVILNNPTLSGTISIATAISFDDTLISTLATSNIQIFNPSLSKQALFIKNLNPSGFGNTATGSPLHVESYLGANSGTVPIFVIDPFGRIASGKIITKDALPEYGWSFVLTSNNAANISDIIQYRTARDLEQFTISQSGYLGIGIQPSRHSLQINNQYTTYEDNYEPILSVIGIYQTTSNTIPILSAFNCNQAVRFNLTSNGSILFHSHQLYGDVYSLENTQWGYIKTLNTPNLFTEASYLDGSDQVFSNIQKLSVQQLDIIKGGSFSNIYINGLTTTTIATTAFEYIDKPATNYREFRIATPRLLFYGSNLVMNWNHNFFEVEQIPLPDDNLRIYANGGPTDSVNLIQTIANNKISTLRMNNCNVAENTATRIQVSANNKQYSLGTIYKSSGTEAFVTNSTDLTNTNRALSITNTGIRVGTSIHAVQTGQVTFGDTTSGTKRLNVKGDVLVKNNGTPYFHIAGNGNIGVGTDGAQRNVDIRVPKVYVAGNLGIGSTILDYKLDVNGTIRATRVLGIQYADVSNISRWEISNIGCNIYYIYGNVGIGSTNPSALLSIEAPITKDLLIQITNSNQNITTSGLEYRKNNSITYGQHVGDWQYQSKLSIQNSLAIGYSSMSNVPIISSNTLIVDGSIGIGTTLPSRNLHVQKDIRIIGHTSNEGRLYIGSNLNENIGGGIYFGGTFGDNSFNHTVIENRVYSTGTEKSELLLFKGNDVDSISGPDRIRLYAGQIDFDVYSSPTLNRSNENIVVSVRPSRLNVTGTTTSTSGNTYVQSLQSLNGARILKYNEYRTAGTYTITQPPNYSYVRVQMWGAGGGGGGANIQETVNYAVGTQLGGGGGGGGGAYGDVTIPYDIAGYSTLSATIGTGGAGGLNGYISSSTQITTTTTSSGANGQAATSGTAGTATSLALTTTGVSSFTYTWTVGGGGAGAVGVGTNAGAAGTGGTITVTTYFDSTKPGTAGGAGGTTGAGANGTSLTGGAATGTGTGLGASGGGGGGGSPASRPATQAYYSGGNSGAGCIPYSFLTGTAIFAYGDKRLTDGTILQFSQDGYTYTDTYGGGTGGGGGFSKNGNLGAGVNAGGARGAGGSGNNGGWPGGGGGGGGAGRTIHKNATEYGAQGFAGGGGNGADGGMLVTFY